MYYGYICGASNNFQEIIESSVLIHVITEGYQTPEEADMERTEKIKVLRSTSKGRSWYLCNCYGSQGVFKSKEPIVIPDGCWGVTM